MKVAKVAAHRVTDMNRVSENLAKKNELTADVKLYVELRQEQADAVEDGECGLASSIGRFMRQIREKHDAWRWEREFEKAEHQQ